MRTKPKRGSWWLTRCPFFLSVRIPAGGEYAIWHNEFECWRAFHPPSTWMIFSTEPVSWALRAIPATPPPCWASSSRSVNTIALATAPFTVSWTRILSFLLVLGHTDSAASDGAFCSWRTPFTGFLTQALDPAHTAHVAPQVANWCHAENQFKEHILKESLSETVSYWKTESDLVYRLAVALLSPLPAWICLSKKQGSKGLDLNELCGVL